MRSASRPASAPLRARRRKTGVFRRELACPKRRLRPSSHRRQRLRTSSHRRLRLRSKFRSRTFQTASARADAVFLGLSLSRTNDFLTVCLCIHSLESLCWPHYSAKDLFRKPMIPKTICIFIASIVLLRAEAGAQAIAATPTRSDQAILQELEQMRARIQELEAELQQRQNVAATPDPQPPATSEAKEAEPTPASEPFAFADFTWLNGNSRTKESPLDTKVFTGEFRLDASYIYDFNHPKDDTLVGSSESGRTSEFQVQQLGVGGDFHYNNIRGRVMTQFGMYSSMTPRNDASPARGQWDLNGAYRYLSEAYGGYHFDALHGINLDAGIFMSYVGLFSYYNFDNWAYQPSYVSSNTPWFFNGLRLQVFPTNKLKIEPWLVNGWQAYGRFNHRPGLGLQVLWRPNGALSILGNQYGLGRDSLGVGKRTRWHTDDSIEVKYFDKHSSIFYKAAFSRTLDAGCESGGGVSCFGNTAGGPKQSFCGR